MDSEEPIEICRETVFNILVCCLSTCTEQEILDFCNTHSNTKEGENGSWKTVIQTEEDSRRHFNNDPSGKPRQCESFPERVHKLVTI